LIDFLADSNVFRRSFYSIGLQSSSQTARMVHDTFWAAATSWNVNATVYYTFQPITTEWAQASKTAGGDVLSLDPSKGNLMCKFQRMPNHTAAQSTDDSCTALLLSATWTDATDDAAILRFFQNVSKNITRKAKLMGQSYDFAYLNDAAADEKPFTLYGGGSSLPKLKQIAMKYGKSIVSSCIS